MATVGQHVWTVLNWHVGVPPHPVGQEHGLLNGPEITQGLGPAISQSAYGVQKMVVPWELRGNKQERNIKETSDREQKKAFLVMDRLSVPVLLWQVKAQSNVGCRYGFYFERLIESSRFSSTKVGRVETFDCIRWRNSSLRKIIKIELLASSKVSLALLLSLR